MYLVKSDSIISLCATLTLSFHMLIYHQFSFLISIYSGFLFFSFLILFCCFYIPLSLCLHSSFSFLWWGLPGCSCSYPLLVVLVCNSFIPGLRWRARILWKSSASGRLKFFAWNGNATRPVKFRWPGNVSLLPLARAVFGNCVCVQVFKDQNLTQEFDCVPIHT